ncbi:MAG: ABC transporter permease [Dehalococcoidia bacterium]
MRFAALVKKELRSIKREKTIMFALFIQLFIAAFSSFLMIGVMSFYDPESIGENTRIYVDIGVVGETNSPIADYAENTPGITINRFDDLETAEEQFRSGRIDAVMAIPPTTSGIVEMKLILPQSDTESMLITMALEEPLKEAENHLREQNGIDLRYDDLEGKPHTDFEFLYSIIIPVLMFFPALIAGSITIDTISEELQNKTLDTLWSAPISLWGIFSSKIFTAGITAVAQCILWMGLLLLNGLSVHNIPPVLLLATLIAFCVSFGAGIIAVVLKDRERAQFVYSIGLAIVAGLSYLVNPSPFELTARLAAGGQFAGLVEVTCYLVPLVGLGSVFFLMSKRLAAA